MNRDVFLKNRLEFHIKTQEKLPEIFQLLDKASQVGKNGIELSYVINQECKNVLNELGFDVFRTSVATKITVKE